MLVTRPDIYLNENTSSKLKKFVKSINMRNYRAVKHQVKLVIKYKQKTKTNGKYLEKHLTELSILGKGGFGTVFKAEYLDELVAVKKCIRDEASRTEVKTLKHLNECENIINLIDSFEIKKSGSLSELWQIIELCECGDLSNVMKILQRTFKTVELKMISVDVLKGLSFMHQNNFIHRDIKGLNLLMNHMGIIKICDLGSVSLINSKQNKKKSRTKIVSDLWMAPEILLANEFDEKVDIWSFGITLIELSRGKPPFVELTGSLALGNISSLHESSKIGQMMQLGLDSTSKLDEFIMLFLNTDVQLRPSATQLLKENFIKKPVRSSLRKLAKEIIERKSKSESEFES